MTRRVVLDSEDVDRIAAALRKAGLLELTRALERAPTYEAVAAEEALQRAERRRIERAGQPSVQDILAYRATHDCTLAAAKEAVEKARDGDPA